MKVSYDKESDAMSIHMVEAEVSWSQEIADGVIVDIDKDGHIIGLEILNASSKVPLDKITLS